MDTLFKKQLQLSKRIRKNFNDYKAAMLKMNRQELFDHALEITAYQITYRHMGHVSQYDEPSLDYLLKFENPLQVISDKYQEEFRYAENVLGPIVAQECDRQDGLADYPTIKKHGEPER